MAVNAVDYVILTVSSDGGGTITFNETAPISGYPFMLVTDNPFEIMRADSQGGDAYTINVTRAQEGTTQQTLSSGTKAVCELTHVTLEDIYDELLVAEKIMGNAYTTTERNNITPDIGELALDTTEGKVYIGVSGSPNTWEEFNPDTHSSYANLLSSTGHLQYYTLSRGDTWHTNLSDEHLNTVDHDHLTVPIANIRSLSSQPSDTLEGGIYLNSSNSTLYFYDLDTASWKQYDTVPQHMLIFREDGSCPDGWSEKTGWSGKYLKGADAGVWTGGSGGSLTHTHVLTEIPEHAHTVPSRNISISSTGSHSHTIQGGRDSGNKGDRISDQSDGRSTGSSGGHTHSITISQHNTNNAGTTSASSESESSEPVNVELTICEKI